MSKRKQKANLDFSNMGSWPKAYKIGFCVLLCLLIAALLWFFMTKDKLTQLENLEQQEITLRKDFADKQGRAANLEPLQQQLAEMELQLQQMMRQLPSKTEMPDIIQDISQTAIASGIRNELFQPGGETVNEYYAERPITLRMVGSYHQFGAFVSGVASLPRVVIMTMHDIGLKSKEAKDKQSSASLRPNSPLTLEGTIKTYRYLDEEEVAEQEKLAKEREAQDAKKKAGGANK